MERREGVEFEASVEEYTAIHRCVDTFVYFLEHAWIPTDEQAALILTLRSLQTRARESNEGVVTWRCPLNEARALASAISCYSRLVVIAMPYVDSERKYKDLVMAFADRYREVVMLMLS